MARLPHPAPRSPPERPARLRRLVAKPDAYWEARLVAAQERNGNWLLFARQDNHLVGMVGAFTSEDIHLADIVYVTPPARGQGIAQRLMAALLDELAQSDTLETARLTVNQDQLPAVALYRRFGFTYGRR